MWPTDREKEQEKHIFYYSKTPISLSLKFIPQIVSDNIDILYVSIWCIKKKKYVCSILYPSLPWNAMDYCKETCKLLADKSPRAQKPMQ